MFRMNTLFSLCLVCVLGFSSQLFGQNGNFYSNLDELPVTLSWDNDGVRITAKKVNDNSGNLLKMTPFRYLDQIGTDLIRVALDTKNTPVVIDLTDYYQPTNLTTDSVNSQPKIHVYMPGSTLVDYNEPRSFKIELKNFSNSTPNSYQAFLIKGIDVLHVASGQCANSLANQNRVVVNVQKCEVKHLLMKGGVLNLDNIENRISNLCRKYNQKYFGEFRSDAFVSLQDCKPSDTISIKRLKHGRSLITKYNITDFEDALVAYLGDIIFTKKGVGLNIKTEEQNKLKLKNNSKKVPFNAYDYYRFFPWYEFVNLSFSKYIDDHQLMIKDPYNKGYIYNTKVYFTNVELIQFFNELKVMISTASEEAESMVKN